MKIFSPRIACPERVEGRINADCGFVFHEAWVEQGFQPCIMAPR